jgi:predicted XRE-type DNA-binding protein
LELLTAIEKITTMNKDYNFPNYQELEKELTERENFVNVDLPTNTNLGEKIKYEIGQKILSFQQENQLNYESLAEMIGLSLSQTIEILRGNTNLFSLESLVNFANSLPWGETKIHLSIETTKPILQKPKHSQIGHQVSF